MDSATTRLTAAIEDTEALDAPARALGNAAHALTANESVRAALQGETLGTPVHPAAVHLPIGLAVGALAVDVLGGRRMEPAVVLLTRLAMLSAIPAALTGLADYARRDAPADRRVGAVHGLVNVSATKLAFASCLTRMAGHRGTARGLLAASVAAYGLGGFLGGHLAHGGD